MTSRIALVLLLAGLMPGCLGDAAGPGTGGLFSATLSGDLQADILGTSMFASETGHGFSLVMSSHDQVHIIGFARSQASRPGTGSHPIVATEEAAQAALLAAYARHGPDPVHLVSTSGTIEVTTSTARRLQGSYSFAARGYVASDPETELTVTVSGTFDAVCAGVTSAMCN
jgi:hypothetical protein